MYLNSEIDFLSPDPASGDVGGRVAIVIHVSNDHPDYAHGDFPKRSVDMEARLVTAGI